MEPGGHGGGYSRGGPPPPPSGRKWIHAPPDRGYHGHNHWAPPPLRPHEEQYSHQPVEYRSGPAPSQWAPPPYAGHHVHPRDGDADHRWPSVNAGWPAHGSGPNGGSGSWGDGSPRPSRFIFPGHSGDHRQPERPPDRPLPLPPERSWPERGPPPPADRPPQVERCPPPQYAPPKYGGTPPAREYGAPTRDHGLPRGDAPPWIKGSGAGPGTSLVTGLVTGPGTGPGRLERALRAERERDWPRDGIVEVVSSQPPRHHSIDPSRREETRSHDDVRQLTNRSSGPFHSAAVPPIAAHASLSHSHRHAALIPPDCLPSPALPSQPSQQQPGRVGDPYLGRINDPYLAPSAPPPSQAPPLPPPSSVAVRQPSSSAATGSAPSMARAVAAAHAAAAALSARIGAATSATAARAAVGTFGGAPVTAPQATPHSASGSSSSGHARTAGSAGGGSSSNVALAAPQPQLAVRPMSSPASTAASTATTTIGVSIVVSGRASRLEAALARALRLRRTKDKTRAAGGAGGAGGGVDGGVNGGAVGATGKPRRLSARTHALRRTLEARAVAERTTAAARRGAPPVAPPVRRKAAQPPRPVPPVPSHSRKRARPLCRLAMLRGPRHALVLWQLEQDLNLAPPAAAAVDVDEAMDEDEDAGADMEMTPASATPTAGQPDRDTKSARSSQIKPDRAAKARAARSAKAAARRTTAGATARAPAPDTAPETAPETVPGTAPVEPADEVGAVSGGGSRSGSRPNMRPRPASAMSGTLPPHTARHGALPPHAAKKRRVLGAVSGAITEQEELELAMAISASMAEQEPLRARDGAEEGESEAMDEEGDVIDETGETDESGEDTPLIARMQRAKAKAAFGAPDPSAAPAAAPEMVGQLIEIYWPLDEQWYAASVTKWVERSGRHRVLYIEDGSSEFVNLEQERWRPAPAGVSSCAVSGAVSQLVRVRAPLAGPSRPPALSTPSGHGAAEGGAAEGSALAAPAVAGASASAAGADGATARHLDESGEASVPSPKTAAEERGECARTVGVNLVERYRAQRRQSQALRRASLTTSMVITPTYWKPPLATEHGPHSLTSGSVASRGERSRQRSLHVGLSGLLDLNELKARKKKLIFGKSAIHSWGLYAAEAIEKEDFVVEYLGEYVRKAVSEVRENHYRRWGWGDDYIFRVDDDLFVDATRRGGLARFANHCCEPNCYTRIIKAGGKQRIVLYSKERIEQGEEITYNYQFDYEDDRSNAIPCCCGARKCTGWLN